jgi:putative peptidoglycan lipid II flippase
VWAYALQQVATRAFYALGDSVTPVRISLWMVLANFLLNVALIWTPLGVGGLALSTAIAAVVQIVIMTHVMRRRMGVVVDREVRGSMARTVLASAIMAACMWPASLAFRGEPSWAMAVAATLVLTGVGTIAFVVASRQLKMPELGWAIRGKS